MFCQVRQSGSRFTCSPIHFESESHAEKNDAKKLNVSRRDAEVAEKEIKDREGWDSSSRFHCVDPDLLL